jgi:hypothetical protein
LFFLLHTLSSVDRKKCDLFFGRSADLMYLCTCFTMILK